ncbi:MAG TPA: TetR/AcrR family transcriptional regulator [Myxococcota bacterium]|nr:TetR/AcrR family transcriptional regulator [Myxococcota bacterium]
MAVSRTRSRKSRTPLPRARASAEPGAGRASERARAATRERLRQSGLELFAERGLHAVTTHDVAAQAGVAAGTFYLHFADKEELFRELVFEAVGELEQRFETHVHPLRGRPEAVARARAEVLLAFAEEHTGLVRLAFGRGAEGASVGADALDHLAARLELELCTEPDEWKAGLQPSVAAQAIVGMWARVVSWWAEAPGRAPRAAVLETMVDLQLSGIRGGPS